MIFQLLADLVVILHLAFIVFALFGGLLVLWRRWFIWAHIPAVIWALIVEFSGRICPLTPFENELRMKAGEAGYSGGFIEHYITSLIYPAGLNVDMQIILGLIAACINIFIYAIVGYRIFFRKRS